VGRRRTRSVKAGLLASVFALVMPLSLFLAPGVAFGVRTIGITAPSFDFSVLPGGKGKGDIVVINRGDEPMKVLVYSADQKVDAKGKVDYTVPNRTSKDLLNSPAMWLNVSLPATMTKSFGNVPYVELTPGQQVPVHFEFAVPSAAAPGDHQLFLFFEMFETEKPAGADIQGRVGSRIRIRAQGTLRENVDVQPFSMRSIVIGDQVPWVFTIRNRGNVDHEMTGHLSVFDGNQEETNRTVVVTETPVYAGTDKEVSGVLKLQGIWIGRYAARLDVSYPPEAGAKGEPRHVIKERTIWLAPLWLIVVLVAMIGAGLLWVMWRGALKSARKSARVESGTVARAGTGDAAGPADRP
jgi:hypothetical protein